LVDERLKCLLSLAIGNEKERFEEILKLKSKLEDYFNNKYKISKKCNYLKHRGMYNIIGLESNPKTAFEDFGITAKIVLDGAGTYDCPPKKLIHREEIDVEIIFKELIDFKNLFIIDFDQLIKLVIPNNYVVEKGGFEQLLKNFVNLSDIEVHNN